MPMDHETALGKILGISPNRLVDCPDMHSLVAKPRHSECVDPIKKNLLHSDAYLPKFEQV